MKAARRGCTHALVVYHQAAAKCNQIDSLELCEYVPLFSNLCVLVDPGLSKEIARTQSLCCLNPAVHVYLAE